MMIHVKRLILLAGVPCVGKSFLIKRIREGSAPLLSEQLEMSHPSSWMYVSASELPAGGASFIEQMVLHYDLLGPWEDGRRDYEACGVLGAILDGSDEATVVTLWATPEDLLRRLRQRQARLLWSFRNWRDHQQRLYRWRRFRRIERLYADPPRLFAQYDQWFAFCSRYRVKAHYMVISVSDVSGVIPVAQWSDVKDAYGSKPALRHLSRGDLQGVLRGRGTG